MALHSAGLRRRAVCDAAGVTPLGVASSAGSLRVVLFYVLACFVMLSVLLFVLASAARKNNSWDEGSGDE